MNKRNRLLTFFIVFFLLLSATLLIYPFADEQLYIINQHNIIQKYNDTFSLTEKAKGTTDKQSKFNSDMAIDLNRLRKDVKEYNHNLYIEHQCNLSSTNSYEVTPINLYNYGFNNSIYGYISIDKIGLNMAIYLGASEYHMSIGAACLSETSIPYGGKNTNSVIAGHCGFGNRSYFRYIENLENGDIVKVTTPFGCRIYKVTTKKVINPKDVKSILIQKGKDMITLITCYPYPTSKKRICVFCKRIND